MSRGGGVWGKYVCVLGGECGGSVCGCGCDCVGEEVRYVCKVCM